MRPTKCPFSGGWLPVRWVASSARLGSMPGTPPHSLPIHTLRDRAVMDPAAWADIYDSELERRFELAYYEWLLRTGRAENERNRQQFVNVVSRQDRSWMNP